ncbi:PhoH family protein [Anoxybacillus sp. LAT_35]|uniref:PhoH family protein n=1 Tax=unclassified Anoxybacillus TaxID=2639704 RepID=UPI001ED9E368|nr:PhoH family protein [Anoxybacillus sp. LAT_26]MCG3083626.1 PhoH family protein [Anoxybacillus sp. LAT27]MCG5025267.1 PhoH family protein [Anoxybacillus flavithermus]MCG6171423.1 PhoH family protein [Anoxybacillus sp. LAT_11]MCG6175332.1 PhoH family protein [Anoxybacillus sp. LAT_31]MCG6178756.1 PhoH family protein [Anoxybacillus sp. LAT_35]MCG6179291.1 PhoH family protein [Anoxybacillus sp. LAT_33]MCG6195775.1 PhoH family protein [Anoxybacillus sp. LAT_38]
MSKKIYVLDTNVLLQDPYSIFSFQDNEVVIPAVVLEEVDSKKRYMDEVGRNARQVSKIIDNLRKNGKLHEKIPLDNGGVLRIELNHRSFQQLQEIFVEKTNDNRILAVAKNLSLEEQTKENGRPVILVSKDALVRVKADAIGLEAEDFLSDRVVEIDHIYTGFLDLYISPEHLARFYEKGELVLSEITNHPFYPNQFIIMKDALGGSSSALGMVDHTGKKVRKLIFHYDHIWGIRPRNVQQTMACELLLRTDIPLVTLIGKAGTGKTLLALAAGLMQTEDLRLYKKLLVARPIVPVGKDIGYLPGEKQEKLRPWMQPIFDNLHFLFDTKKPSELDAILSGMGSIEVEALTYIRGRSIPEQFIIIDEAQNLTKHEVKTILTRVGERSKIVLMGDPAQIDHPYLDEYNNGLTYVVEKFKDQKVAGHVRLIKGERSSLAQLAADLL